MSHKMTAVHHLQDDDFLDESLQGTSRTFALAIPLLSIERRRQIGLSYLLFRVADSIEDAPEGDGATKKVLLTSLRESLLKAQPCITPCSEERRSEFPIFDGLWPRLSPTGRLLSQFPRLIAILDEMPSSVSQAIRKALTSTITGMIGFIDASMNSPNQIQIQGVDELRLYCYAVAGVVGELLTDIFVFHHPAALVAHGELRRLAVGFGEFLQLINILKDADRDATSGRVFIPVETTRENIYELALEGREEALVYIRTLEKNDFPTDVVLFCRFVYLLSEGSLQKLREGGVGSKLTRDEVNQILTQVKSSHCVLPV